MVLGVVVMVMTVVVVVVVMVKVVIVVVVVSDVRWCIVGGDCSPRIAVLLLPRCSRLMTHVIQSKYNVLIILQVIVTSYIGLVLVLFT